MSESIAASLVISLAIILAGRMIATTPGKTRRHNDINLKESFLYGDRQVLAERIAISEMAMNLIAQRMTDPLYHEEIARYKTAELDNKTRDRAESLLREKDVFASPTQDKFVRLAWDVYDHVEYLQRERLRGWYSSPVDSDDLRARAKGANA